MGVEAVRIEECRGVLVNNTTDWAFGPVADECERCGITGQEMLEAFLQWFEDEGGKDIRVLGDVELDRAWGKFLEAHALADEELGMRVG